MQTEMDVVQAVYCRVLAQIPAMALSIASSPLPSIRSHLDVAQADGHREIELGALDLYDAGGWFLDRITFAGDREALFLDLRQLMPPLLSYPCTCVILRHRHPSGFVAPSQADIVTTRSFADILRLLGIKLYDHLIEGPGRQFSFRAEGLL